MTDTTKQAPAPIPPGSSLSQIARTFEEHLIYLEGAIGRLEDAIGESIFAPAELTPGELITAEPVPHLLCLGCLIEQHQGARTHPNPAVTIVNGQSTCREHLQFADGPILPGRTPSGIILGNGS